MAEMTEQEKQEKAKQFVQDEAKKAATDVFRENIKQFLKTELGSDEAKALMKEIAEKALSTLEIDEDGKKSALTTILKEMNDAHNQLSATVKSLKDGEKEAVKDFLTEVKNSLTQHKDALLSLKEAKKDPVTFSIKAAGTMLISTNYTGGTYFLTNGDNQFARIQRRQPFMRELARVLTTDNMHIAWAEQANPDPGVAGMVAEGAAKPQTDFDIVERSAKVEKIAVWIKVSREALADIKFLMSEINTELRELVELKLDEQILSGNGTSPNLRGVYPIAPAFAPVATMAALVPTPNRYDVIMAAVAQISAANFEANAVILNPADFYSLKLTKDANGNYILPPFMAGEDREIAGLRVVANNGVPVGQFLVGDFTKLNLAIREDVNIQIGYENDDFTKNLVTILAEMRAVVYVKTNHLNAFVKGTFVDAMAALELPAEPAA